MVASISGFFGVLGLLLACIGRLRCRLERGRGADEGTRDPQGARRGPLVSHPGVVA